MRATTTTIAMAGMIAAMALTTVPAAAQQVGPQPAQPGAAKPVVIQTPGEVAKRAPVNGVLVLYGNERCPTNTDGQEIVICERRSAREQYRVPKELREFQVTPQNESWAARAQGTLDTGVGVNGIGTCSTVGAGGQTGCFVQNARAARKENQARKAEEARIP
ncbi:hypothetical protein [Sphingomonas sp. CLY1604]|uniref:hypothetical protein n=1 Tax=Sphingomonas sp. CLY1604 TaxID=3457786 RepID=UPI003FD86585